MKGNHPRYLARLAKHVSNWPTQGEKYNGVGSLSADFFTQELNTDNNEISWWGLDDLGDNEEILGTASALISPFNSGPSKKLHIICVPYAVFLSALDILHTPEHARTAMLGFDAQHYDIVNLNYSTLGIMGRSIAESFASLNGSLAVVKTVNREDTLNYIKRKRKQGQVSDNSLGKWLKEQLGIIKK